MNDDWGFFGAFAALWLLAVLAGLGFWGGIIYLIYRFILAPLTGQ